MSNEPELFYPQSPTEWRKWLQEHHITQSSVWVVFYKKQTGIPTLTWSEAVDEALCFGWIDSVKKKLDEQRSIQYFSKRKPTSMWSKINKDKVDVLITNGRMMPAGMACIDLARQNGTWSMMDEAETLEIPPDLQAALAAVPGTTDFFVAQSRSRRKSMLQWLLMAKTPATRTRRVQEIVLLASQQRTPPQFG
jgi:uncharacterized protein YdeI (YjbR/CyaY-like superfamily)